MNCNNKNMLMMNSCFRRVCSRKVLACSSLCQGSVSWIPRGKTLLRSGQDCELWNDLCFQSTIGAAFLTQTVCLDDTTVKFEIWDTAGQERYHSLAPMYYRGAQAAIVVYDITNADTFERAKSWVKELQKQVEIITRRMLITQWYVSGQPQHSHCIVW